MVEPEQTTDQLDPLAPHPAPGGESTRKSIWPAIYPEILDLVEQHRSTLVFVNNRRLAERVALRINELARDRKDAAEEAARNVEIAPGIVASDTVADDGEIVDKPPAVRPVGPLLRRTGARSGVPGRRAVRDRPSAPRLPRARGAPGGGGAAQERRAAVPGGDELPGARHRHGRRGSRDPDRVAEVGLARAAAHRPRRAHGRSDGEGPHLPQVPRRPARVRGRRVAHADRIDRDDHDPAQPARRARAADRRDRGGRRHVRGVAQEDRERRGGGRGRGQRRLGPRRRRGGARPPRVSVPGPPPIVVRGRARPARRALSVGGVQRAAAAARVGSRRGHVAGPQGRAHAGDRQRRHDPGPRPLHGRAAGRPARRRARRGDGARGPGRADVPAGRLELADRGDPARPRGRDACARGAGGDSLLARRLGRAAPRAGGGDRQVRTRGGRRGTGRAGGRVRPRRARRQEPRGVPARAARRDDRHPERPHPGAGTLPRRDRRLAPRAPLSARRPGPRGLGAGDRRAHPRGPRPGIRRDLERRGPDPAPPGLRRRADAPT